MSLARIEAELAVATEKVATLREALQAAEEWATALQTSADVLRRLESLPPSASAGAESSPITPDWRTPFEAKRPKLLRGQLIADAARKILEDEGRRIKSVELGEMLIAQGFDIGRGHPGKITSDLSNQLGRYGRGLLSSRSYGWGLTEWGDERAPGPGPKAEQMHQDGEGNAADPEAEEGVGEAEDERSEQPAEGVLR
jgi:hypothetical protein